MSTHVSGRDFGPATTAMPDTPETVRAVAGLWWLWLVTGAAWFVAGLVVLQFDSASITTVGVIIGLMFVFAAVQQFAVGALNDGGRRWLSLVFGALFLVAGIVAIINPEETFAGFADILGFMFLTVGIWWTIRAFVERDINPVWWLGLIGGVLMLIMAFWASGQFFIEKAYTLLVFAGVWALMKGVEDVIRAFAVRSVRHML